MNGSKHTGRAYVSPEVTELGSVESMTQGPFGGAFDSLFGADGGLNPFVPREGGETS